MALHDDQEIFPVPVRIYSLAKDLNLDSKELVDICNRIGIPGKGSALASLEDEEVARIKKHVSAASAPPQPARSERQLRQLPRFLQRFRLVVVIFQPSHRSLPSRTKKNVESAPPATAATATVAEVAAKQVTVAPVSEESPEAVEVVEVEQEEVVEESVVAAASVAEETLDEEELEVVDGDAESSPSTERGRYIPPLGSSGGKIRVIGSRSKAPLDSKPLSDEKRKPKSREPVINLAKIPKSGQTPAAPKRNEPAPQRPEIKLTKDMIVDSKRGVKGPLDQFVRQEDQKSKAAQQAMGPGGLSQFKAAADSKAKTRTKGDEIEEEEEGKGRKGLAGIAASRADRSKKRLKLRPDEEVGQEEERSSRRTGRTLVRKGSNTAAPRKENVALELPCTVRSFSEAAGVPAARVLRSLMAMGIQTLNINATLELNQAMALAQELGVDLDFKEAESLESTVLGSLDKIEDAPEDLVARPPIVTFLGHVDHGKTSLLDYLIGTKIVAGEAGGITQHIRAYQVEKDGRFVSFVDTPGHEAFTEMRARGANVTDIAVLVIAADDGIMPQTEEAISHAKAAGVPIVVALNKIDLPGADANRVMTQMTQFGLTPSEWGGDVEVVPTSAITGQAWISCSIRC